MTSPSLHPPIHVQQSTPSPGGFEPPPDHQPSMLEETPASRTSWDHFGSQSHLSPHTVHHPFDTQTSRSSHKRASSGSSVASGGPASPYTPTSTFPQIVDSDSPLASSHLDFLDGAFSATGLYSKPLPTSSRPHFPETFLAPAFQNYNYDVQSLMAAQSAMRQALMEHNGSEVESAQSSRRRTSYGDSYDESMRSSTDVRSNVPKLDRTMSDIYQDELYNPASATSVAQARPPVNQSNLLSPYDTVFSRRLQAANNDHISARSASPASNNSRQRSPFRQTSEYAAEEYSTSRSNPNSPLPRLGSVAYIREQQKAEADAIAIAQHQPSSNHLVSPRTISPKEALLDYTETTEDAKMPLFPQEKIQKRDTPDHQFSSVNSGNRQFSQSDADDPATERSYGSMATSRRESSSNFSTSSVPTPSGSNFTFVPPAIPGNVQMPQQYPFISRRQSSSIRSTTDQAPEFPSHLTSMESTKSENDLTETTPEIVRPPNTMADSGSYTCTNSGCILRFETSAKLQKHKREAHRQSTPQVVSQSSSAAVSNSNPASSGNSNGLIAAGMNRNNQAGPHKCERINPSTGKPCNTIFSRSYDLTRHEDTIHNARKQKVRCHLCTEEKTFSRNDALTRHMRVVHPDVEFPGKIKRRAGN
ncbi:hypothetical protein MMC12_006623 [Toensbergia leucococca]|nr:hypothetical protein [Toensbergia leucococca]